MLKLKPLSGPTTHLSASWVSHSGRNRKKSTPSPRPKAIEPAIAQPETSSRIEMPPGAGGRSCSCTAWAAEKLSALTPMASDWKSTATPRSTGSLSTGKRRAMGAT
jgi:hypothetical protein